MPSRFPSLIALLFLSMTGAVFAKDWEAIVQQRVEPIVEKLPGTALVVGLMTPDGKRVVLPYGQLRVDGPETTKATLFQIGSVTKTMTALLLATEVERGSVKLETPVRELLPDDMPVPRHGDAEITLLELATHSSGLPRLTGNHIAQQFAVAFATGGNDPNPYKDYNEEMLREGLAATEIADEPKFGYSNLSYGLLGFSLARHADESIEALLKQRIFAPLEMRDTTITLDESDRERMAQGYDWMRNEAAAWEFDVLQGCGAVTSTAPDMLKYVAAQMDDGESPLLKAIRMTHRKHKGKHDDHEMGLGWFVRTVHDEEVYWHNGATAGYTAYVAFCPARKVGLVVLSNIGPNPFERKAPAFHTGQELLKELLSTELVETSRTESSLPESP